MTGQLSLDQLDSINRQWLAYYNNERAHQGVDIGNKVLRPDFKPSDNDGTTPNDPPETSPV
ncbi:hypothetical protein P4B35_22490 [Pontiellaceae bacterium B12227]|nr:hypothetical protein [Pontiellaceae bacterium B12227]